MISVWTPDELRCILDSLARSGQDYGPEYRAALDDVAIALGQRPVYARTMSQSTTSASSTFYYFPERPRP